MSAWQPPSALQEQAASPLFSVVIPTYQRREKVVAAVLSALDQTVSLIEVIVVIDGSTDDTEQALLEIDDPRLRVIVQPNRGASAARNAGIAQAKGRYIAFLDCDDRFLPHHLADLLPLLQQDENVVAYGQVLVDRGEGRNFLKPPRAIATGETIDRYLMCDRGFIQTSSLALSRGLADKVRYREDVKFGDDTDFAVRLALAGGQFKMTPGPARSGPTATPNIDCRRFAAASAVSSGCATCAPTSPPVPFPPIWAGMRPRASGRPAGFRRCAIISARCCVVPLVRVWRLPC
ncbi:glycosyltransferase family 2 protein [Sphingobium scionense]